MSQHRQHYFEANWKPETQPGFENSIGQLLAVGVLAVVAMGAAFAHLASTMADDQPVVTPVRSPVIEHFELPPIDVEDARIEGYRAGFDTAIQQGCMVTLTHPIGDR